MQILELHFNSKQKEEQIFDSFVYEPENAYERNLGSLYIIGQLGNVLPSNNKLLDNFAQTVKKSFYNLSFNSQEKALSQASKKANDFLAQEVKKENVSWLGNLNCAILSLANFNLNFTKTGNLKVLLLRGEEAIDIGKNLDLEEIDPYPLKIFFNTVSGKLTENDKILVLTKQVFEFFKEKNILAKLGQIKELSSKDIKKLLPVNPKISGICFIVLLNGETEKKEINKPVLFQDKPLTIFQKFNLISRIRQKIARVKLPKIKIPSPAPLVEKFKKQTRIKKKIILIAVLIGLMILGFYIFKEREEKEINLEQEIEQKADNLEKLDNPEIVTEAGSLDLLYSLSGSIQPPSVSSVELPGFDFSFDISASYFSNFYFLDKNNCKIIKYPHLWGNNWGPAQIWKQEDNNCSNPKSMAIDGSIWILNKDNSVLQYHNGSLKQALALNFSPLPQNITAIRTKPNVPYLYLLEPAQKRIIVIDKTGQLIKQFQSEKFDNLKNLEISATGKTIYVLNNSTIYKIKLIL